MSKFVKMYMSLYMSCVLVPANVNVHTWTSTCTSASKRTWTSLWIWTCTLTWTWAWTYGHGRGHGYFHVHAQFPLSLRALHRCSRPFLILHHVIWFYFPLNSLYIIFASYHIHFAAIGFLPNSFGIEISTSLRCEYKRI